MTTPARVIAAIDGHTMGAGLELARACDVRIATRRPEFAFPEVRPGMVPGGGTRRALRLMGMTHDGLDATVAAAVDAPAERPPRDLGR